MIEVMKPRDPDMLSQFARRCGEILPAAHGTALAFLADTLAVAAAYDNGESLLWRDAGAMLQNLALAATAFRLAFCPLGILGSEVAQGLAVPRSRMIAVGAAMVGRPEGS